ncbi:MAG: SMC family ATPase [Candidatus Daviesbacteria bacterium]
MIPVKLKLENFTSYGINVPDLDFSKFHLAAISGLNGAGKSSLLDAITWVLWGTSRLGDSSDQLVRLGQGEMFVEFSFKLDNHIYTVKRIRILKSGGSTSLELLSGTNNLTEGTIKATQQKIINLLHLSFETFTNSAFLRQGHADEFTTKGPTERKRILADILGLSHYDILEEKAKERIREIQSKLQLLDYQVLEIEAQLSQKIERSQKKKEAEDKILELEKEIKNLEEKLKILREQRETLNIASKQWEKANQTYLESKKELEEIIIQGKNRKENIERLQISLDKLEGIEKELQKLKSLQEQKEKLEIIRQKKLETEKKLSEINGEINLKKQKQEQIKNEVIKLKEQLKEAQKPGAKCPTCGQEIGKEEKAHVHIKVSDQMKVLEESLSKIDFTKEEKEAEKLSIDLKSLNYNPQEYQEISHQLSDLEELQQKKEQKVQLQATLENEKKVVLEMRSLYQNKKGQVDKLESEISKYPDLTDKLNEVSKEESEAENQLNLVRSEEKDARSSLGQINELISQTAQLEKTQKQKGAEKVSLEKEKEAYEELALAFGKKGIQAMIIETAIPEIEDETNKLLEKLSEGRMQIHFETQRETKGKIVGTGEKGLVETLDIIISDEMGERPYEAYSGGEQFRVNFAIRLALSKLLTHRAGAKLQFLVIDEGFGTQDAQGRSRIIESLNAVKDDFEKILVITHLDELKEEFPVRIEVNKGPSGSTFEVVGA